MEKPGSYRYSTGVSPGSHGGADGARRRLIFGETPAVQQVVTRRNLAQPRATGVPVGDRPGERPATVRPDRGVQVLGDAQVAARGAFTGSQWSTRATSERMIASIVSMDTCRSTIIVLPSGVGKRRKEIEQPGEHGDRTGGASR